MEDGVPESRFFVFLRKLFGPKGDHPVETLILEAKNEGELKSDEASMLLNILRLRAKQVQDVMVPRTDIVAAEVNHSIRDVAELIVVEGHSRIPIYRETKDQVIGIVHAKDLLKHLLHPDAEATSLETLMRQPLFIPETKNLERMILEFQSNKAHLAIAVDEYGGTSGLITFEDVLEEIVGEIEDEYDEPEPDEVQILEGNRYLISGRAMLEDLARDHGIRLESELVETVGGFVTERTGRVPKIGESLNIDGYHFLVKDADAKQILWLELDSDQKAVSLT